MSNKKFNARHGVSVGTTPVDVIDDTGAVLTNAATATKLLNSRTISISGDVVATGSFDGSGNLDLAATIQANSVALGTDTTGNYMVDVSPGTGVSVSHTQGEGSTATVSIGQAVATTDNVTFNNLTLAGELRGPATFVIDPSAVGDNTGKVVIKGDLQVDGTTTTINSTSTTIDDVVLTLGGDTAPASDDTFDKGIEYRWYDTQARMGFFGFDRSTGKLTFIPQSTLSSGVYSGTTGEIDAKLDWSNVLNKPTIDNTTYNQLAVTTSGGALLRLNSSGGANDDVKFASGTNSTVAYTNDDTITISSLNHTYSVKASSQTNGAGIDLDAGGSGSGTDTVKILGSNGTTVAYTDADTITISSTSVGDGTLSIAAKSAGATNTDVTLSLSGAYSANTSTNRTINAVVGPAISALATFMTTATAGFIRRTAQDTYGIDTNTYLTGNQSISLTGDTTGSGATSIATTTNYITSSDDRVKAPSDDTTAKMRFGFTSWTNDNNSPYADYLHLRSYTDASGGNDNLVMFRKDAIGMRIWQQAHGSATAYSSYKDVAFTDQLPTVNNGALSIATKSAGATNTDITLELSGAYSANTATDRTIKAVVGPALTALSTFMTTATAGFIKRTGQDTYGIDTSTYLTSYSETSTLADVTGRGATTSTNLTLSGGTLNLGHATANVITTSSTANLSILTATQSTTYSRSITIQSGNSSQAGGSTGNLTLRTGNATGLSGAYAGSILIWPGNSDGSPATTTIRGGASVSGNTSGPDRGDVQIVGGENSSAVTSGTVTAGYIYILGGTVTNTSTNVTKYTGGVYISGGGSGAGGTINYGSINIGSLGQTTTYGTSAINIGFTGITTTINGTVKFPDVGTSGFVKLGAGGQLSADTNTYLPLAGGTLSGAVIVSGVDQGLVTQHDGNAAQWYGRILSKNSTADRAAFLGTYGSIAGVFAHNNALNAWAPLYINTVDGAQWGGAVVLGRLQLEADGTDSWYKAQSGNRHRFTTTGGGEFIIGNASGVATINGNQILHAGNYTSYAPAFDNLTSKTGGTGDYMTTGSFIAQNILRVQNGTADWDSLDLNADGATHYINARGAETGLSFQFDGTDRMVLANSGALTLTSGALRQGNNMARPLAEWSASGSATGMVFFELPGDTSNYGMVHMVFDIYEYNGNNAATVIIGGHNWNAGWYEKGVNVIGQTDKQVRLGVRGGKYVVCFGTATSTWSYGTVSFRKIHNGSFYNGVMNMTGPFTANITTSENLTNDSGDLRSLRTPGTFNAGGAITQAGNQVLHAGNYTSYAAASDHNHTYDVNNAWLRDAGDDAHVKLYGNSRQMAFRTDGTTEYASGVGGYPFAWMYGGDEAAQRLMLLNTTGDMWTSTNGWLSTALAGKQNTGSYLTSESDTLSSVTGRGATTASQCSFTKVDDHAISVGTIRGRVVGSQSGDYIHMYERVHIGSPSGWGSRGAPSNGLSTYGGCLLATDAGNVAIGYTSEQNSYKLAVNGAFAATSKSFLIPHPTKEGWKLRYGSLEGPENGVYIRGKLKGKNKIELPEYWTKLVDPDSITVTLTPIGKHQKLYVEDISNNTVTVANDGLFAGEINCFFVVYGERVDIDKLVVEYE